jgi:RNAse (barnase) inhibitor barstar
MKAWSMDELDIAVNMIQSKKTYKEIAEILNRTERSIREKLRKNGFRFSDFNNSVFDEIIECLECKEKFIDKKVNNRKFCSRSCSVSYNNKFKIKNVKNTIDKCKNCNDILNNAVKKYCNIKCQKDFEKKIIFEKIEKGEYKSKSTKKYKEYLIKKYGNKCMDCGWDKIHKITGNVPIQLEHIDGNSNNNNLENLKLLCPNCHSLTETYGSLNKGKGRNERKLYREYLKKLTIEELIEEKNKL